MTIVVVVVIAAVEVANVCRIRTYYLKKGESKVRVNGWTQRRCRRVYDNDEGPDGVEIGHHALCEKKHE